MRSRRRHDEDDVAAEPPKPGTITAIELQKRDNSRVSISIDGAFAFGLHLDLQLEHHLKVGMPLDAQQINTLLTQDATKKAIATALNLLSYRPRATGELRQALRQRGYEQDAIDNAIVRLHELHYIDDEAFAERWIESRQHYRPRSARMLQRELQHKGVDADVAKERIDDAGLDEFGDALALARKRLANRPLDEGETRRLTGFLGRRGYGYDVIRRVLTELGNARHDPESQ